GKEGSSSEAEKYPPAVTLLEEKIGLGRREARERGGEQGAGEAGRIAEVALTSQRTSFRLGPYPLPTNPDRAMRSSALVSRREWVV
ncbi:hypothetical protein ASPBRDRAFT_123775, partial [Aspergillus brasiliensis CBS 101740]